MAFCRQCGAQVADDARFCPACGAFQGPEQAQSAYPPRQPYAEPAAGSGPVTDQDVADNRAMAILAYIGPLALIPYFAAKQSPFAQYHAIRGMNLLILEAVYWVAVLLLTAILTAILTVFGIVIGWILRLGWIFFLVISVLGIVNVCNGEKKDLPIVSGIRFIRH